jgi:D-glycero-alpha-D-manno-heptose-7-phosphate kinase
MIISQTPLRISFVGGGSDVEEFYKANSGAVLSTAIDKYVNVFVIERFDNKIVLEYTRNEVVDSVQDIKHDLIREAMLMTGVEKGVEIYTHADIPSEGTGLGSSSSITVGLLHALYAYRGILPTAKQLAEEACEIEINKLHKPIGRQDQFIAAYGGLKYIKFTKYGIEVNPVECDRNTKKKMSDSMLLFYTGITRNSDSVLADQNSRIADNVEILKEMASLSLAGKHFIENGNIGEVGRLLHQNWGLKKLLSDKISNPEIDKMYQSAIEAGAVGGKINGAGAGGFMLLFVDGGKKVDVREALKDYRELPFAMESDGSKIIFNYRRG